MIRRISIDDVEVYREVRLRALRDSPETFASTYDAEAMRPQPEWADRVARAAAGDERAIFLAFDRAECVGLVGCIEDDLGADRQLVGMWVAPSHRGTGVANGLLDAALHWAGGAHVGQIALWVTRGNHAAQRFYERNGFVVTGDAQPLPSDPCKDEIRMIRRM